MALIGALALGAEAVEMAGLFGAMGEGIGGIAAASEGLGAVAAASEGLGAAAAAGEGLGAVAAAGEGLGAAAAAGEELGAVAAVSEEVSAVGGATEELGAGRAAIAKKVLKKVAKAGAGAVIGAGAGKVLFGNKKDNNSNSINEQQTDNTGNTQEIFTNTYNESQNVYNYNVGMTKISWIGTKTQCNKFNLTYTKYTCTTLTTLYITSTTPILRTEETQTIPSSTM